MALKLSSGRVYYGCCEGSTLPASQFTIHGLWPMPCFCRPPCYPGPISALERVQLQHTCWWFMTLAMMNTQYHRYVATLHMHNIPSFCRWLGNFKKGCLQIGCRFHVPSRILKVFGNMNGRNTNRALGWIDPLTLRQQLPCIPISSKLSVLRCASATLTLYKCCS